MVLISWLLALLASLPAGVFAQPIIENAESFTIGMVLKYQAYDDPSGIVPGPAGPDQVWDFSTLIPLPDTVTAWIVSPATHPLGAQFPTANLLEVHSNGKLIFVNQTAGESFLVGYEDTTDPYPPQRYTDPMLLIKRPITYGMTVTDTFALEYVPGVGIVTVSGDAYGTLILPNRTYTNVLRVKLSGTHPYFTFNAYVWFDSVHRGAVLKLEERDRPRYLLSESEEPSPVEDGNGIRTPCYIVSFYPNPFEQGCLIRFRLGQAGIVRLEVCDVLGRQVAELANGWMPPGTHTAAFDGTHLPAGMYLCRLSIGAVVEQRLLLMLR